MKEPKDMSFTELQELDAALAERDVKLTEQIKALETITPSSNTPTPQNAAQLGGPERAIQNAPVSEEKKVDPDGKGGDVQEMKEEELAHLIEVKLAESFTKLLNEEKGPFHKFGAEWDAFKTKHEKDIVELKDKMEKMTKEREEEKHKNEKMKEEFNVKLKEAFASANAHGVVATPEQAGQGVQGATGGAVAPTETPLERPRTFGDRMTAAARERPRTR